MGPEWHTLLVDDAQLSSLVQQYFLPFARISGLFLTMPVLGTRIVNPRVRIVLAALVAVVVAPIIPDFEALPLLKISTWVVVIRELLIGCLVGFCFQIVFQTVVLAGQIIAMKLGLGFAMMNDPTNGVQTTAISQFNLMVMTLVFVSVNGHLILLELLIQSFETLPIGSESILTEKSIYLARLGSWLFVTALVMALPLLTALLFINIAFGIMSRAAPQLNIFAVGFPFTLVCGMGLVWLGISSFSPFFERVMHDGFLFIKTIIEF